MEPNGTETDNNVNYGKDGTLLENRSSDSQMLVKERKGARDNANKLIGRPEESENESCAFPKPTGNLELGEGSNDSDDKAPQNAGKKKMSIF